MKNYYNEIDPFAAEWIRNLITRGLIPAGDVDTRSIKDVQPSDLAGYTQCHFFAGISGWSLALRIAAWPDAREVWTASCPCQPYSSAGKQKGNADDRDLWPDFYRLARVGRPDVIFGEQVSSAIGHGWLDRIHDDMEAEGYAVGSVVLGAFSVTAPHKRARLFWCAEQLADSDGGRCVKLEELDRAPEQVAAVGATLGRHADGCGIVCPLAHPASNGRPEHVGEPGNGSRRGAGPHDAAECRGACGLADEPSGGQRIDGGPSREPGHAPLRCDAVAQGDSIAAGLQRHAGHGDDGHEPGRFGAVAAGSVAAAGAACAVDNTDDGFAGDRGLQRGGEQRQQPGNGSSNAVADTQRTDAGPGSEGSEGSERGGRARPAISGPWSDFEILHCLDGKSRRAKPGVFPLAARIPRDLGRGQPELRALARGAGKNRSGRLKGYGNAIVPQVAAEFIRAWMETR